MYKFVLSVIYALCFDIKVSALLCVVAEGRKKFEAQGGETIEDGR